MTIDTKPSPPRCPACAVKYRALIAANETLSLSGIYVRNQKAQASYRRAVHQHGLPLVSEALKRTVEKEGSWYASNLDGDPIGELCLDYKEWLAAKAKKGK